MKHVKKILALVLAAVLCLSLLAACANDEKAPADDQDTQSGTDTQEPENQETNDTDSEDGDEEPLEITEIRMMIVATNDYSDADAVMAEVNKITEAEIGVHVDATFLGMGEYSNQLSLAISGGETLDLAVLTPIPASSFATVTATGQAMDISGLVEANCPTLVAGYGEYLDAFRIDGALYGLPVARQKASMSRFRFRIDIAEELGLMDAIENAATWDDITAVLDAVKNGSDVYPLGANQFLNGNTQMLWDMVDMKTYPYDSVGDALYLIYGDETDGQVKCLYQNEQFVHMLELFAEWNEAGYVWPDTLTNTEQAANQLMESDITFAEFTGGEFGTNASMSANFPVQYKEIGEGMVTTSLMTLWSMFIPATAEEPEAALQFVDFLYQSSEVMNLLTWGIEGEHYIVNENGEAAYVNDTVSAADCGYHNSDWIIGDSFLVLPWEGQGANFRVEAEENLRNSPASAFLGFALDTSEMSDMIAALTSVNNEYRPSLLSGLYTEDLLNEFLGKLESAGLADYIAGVQSQLDAWQG